MYRPIQLTSTIPSVRNPHNRSPLWRRVLFLILPTATLVALAVALQSVAEAGTEFFLQKVSLQSSASGSVKVNQALNKIYVSGDPNSTTGLKVVVIDGATFAPTPPVGPGQQVGVDNKTNRYWAETLCEGGSVIVRDGKTNSVVKTISLGYCPMQSSYDFKDSRMWVSAQGGAGHDPIFAINANTFSASAAIDSGGIMDSIIANGVNGRLYLTINSANPVSERVDPTTFAVTPMAPIGEVVAIDGSTNTLYAVPFGTNDLQIIDGKPDPEVILTTKHLSYTPGSVGINKALKHLYIANPVAHSIEVRNPLTGALITTFALSTQDPTATPDGPMAVDSIRGRIYVIQRLSGSTGPMLLVIEDLINATKPDCILSH